MDEVVVGWRRKFRRLWLLAAGPDPETDYELHALERYLLKAGDRTVPVQSWQYLKAYVYLHDMGKVEDVETWPGMRENRTYFPAIDVTVVWV